MAGLGAYGGAGLTGNLASMGEAALAQGAEQGPTLTSGIMGADKAGGVTAAQQTAQAAGFGDKLAAGAKTWDWNKPMDFVQGLGGGSKGKGIGMLAGAFGPGLMEAFAPNQSAMPQTLGDSQRSPPLLYLGGNNYRRMTADEAAARKDKYNYAQGGLATGGAPEWNPEWNPDVPEYGDLGRDFGREILYYNPALTKPTEAVKITSPVLEGATPSGYGSPGGGQDFGGSGDTYGQTSNSLTGGLIGALFGGQPAAPVIDMSHYSDAAAKAATNAQAAYGAPEATGTSGGSPAEAGGGGGFTGADSNGGFGPSSAGELASGGLTTLASGGIGSLGSYSDGGRLLRGPGDGVSDHIPATIGAAKQPARLADGEFVVPARIVSELGNGSTEAGARALYAMMDRIQNNRRKTVGKGRVAVNSKSTRLLPA
jgi:hypothetical protein